MVYSKELADLGFVVFRHENKVGGLKPHVFIRFKSAGGDTLTFGVDTTRLLKTDVEPDAYLITHAHSDHYGKSAMLSQKAWCSKETAQALEIRYEKEYKGNIFEVGETISICGTKVRTFDVAHAPGSTAFFWENENGFKILVTGDVKDSSDLPKCDVLLTEASYGDPDDPGCYFKDDIESLHEAVLSHIGKSKVAFGAYEFGKSQKAVSIIREMGYNGPIAMTQKTMTLTEKFVSGAGELKCFETEDCHVSIVPVHQLSYVEKTTQKYILTCRSDSPFENIRISDHLDVNGLTQMVKDVCPKITIVYHPNQSSKTDKFAKHLEQNGFKAFSINQIQNIVGNQKQIGSQK